MKPPEVVVSKAIQKPVLDYEEFTGRTEALRTVVIRSRVTGYIDDIYFKDGQEVREGMPLIQIDARSCRFTSISSSGGGRATICGDQSRTRAAVPIGRD
jgi:hypothetical protein